MADVVAGGVRFHVQRMSPPGGTAGDRPVVVFLHGLVMDNLSSFYYTLAGPVAQAGAEVIMYDLRGHGRSERPPSGYTVHDAVGDLAALLAELGVDRPVYLVGNSYGGVVALRCALDRPELVAGLVIIEAHTVGDAGGDWTELMSNTLTVTALGLDHDRLADQLRLIGDRKLARSAQLADALLNGTTLIDDVAATPLVRGGELGTVGCPVLAVYGVHSDLADAGRELARHLPNCTLHVVPGQAHTVLREATPVVRTLVLDWLAARPRERGGYGPDHNGGRSPSRGAGPAQRSFLFVVPPLTGHVNPAVAVARELSGRGHRIAWAGRAETLGPLLGPEAEIHDAGDPALDAALADSRERWLRLRGAGALKFLWAEFIVPLARASLPGVEAAVDAVAPDVVLVDQQAVAGALVARRRGLPWATSATTSAELTDPYAAMPKVDEWVREQMGQLCRDAGIEPADLRFSGDLVLAFSSAALIGPGERFPGHYAFVGPALGARPDSTGFPWQALDPARRRVLVSLGTVNGDAGERFFTAMARAAEPLDVQLIVAGPPELLPDPPAHVLIRPYLPQLDLLPHVDAVVCHAGHNTVCEALAHGLPLVVAPIRDDQPIIAGQVAAAGAGVRVRFARDGADRLRTALHAVLTDPAYRDAARRVQASFTAAGGAPAAADRLESLAMSVMPS